MGHGLDERWGGGVWLLGSGKIQFVAVTAGAQFRREVGCPEVYDCGETASGGAAGEIEVGQGTSAIGSGGETVGWATMSRRQRKAWLRGRK